MQRALRRTLRAHAEGHDRARGAGLHSGRGERPPPGDSRLHPRRLPAGLQRGGAEPRGLGRHALAERERAGRRRRRPPARVLAVPARDHRAQARGARPRAARTDPGGGGVLGGAPAAARLLARADRRGAGAARGGRAGGARLVRRDAGEHRRGPGRVPRGLGEPRPRGPARRSAHQGRRPASRPRERGAGGRAARGAAGHDTRAGHVAAGLLAQHRLEVVRGGPDHPPRALVGCARLRRDALRAQLVGRGGGRAQGRRGGAGRRDRARGRGPGAARERRAIRAARRRPPSRGSPSPRTVSSSTATTSSRRCWGHRSAP